MPLLRRIKAIVLCLFVLFTSSYCTLNSDYEEDLAQHVSAVVEAVKGGVANIPCNVSLQSTNNRVHTVIWYKELGVPSKTPIYTFDARDKTLDVGEHWSDEAVLGKRGYFRYDEEPPTLVIANVKESDAGIYQCRVDFRNSPTQNIKILLKVIKPPEQIFILNENGTRINHHVIGPYNEDESVNITCVATGGQPKPNVTWWQENILLDNFSEFSSSKRIKNTLYIQRLQRKDLHKIFTCLASNNNIAPPVSNSVTLDLNLRPLFAKLWGKQRVLSAGNPYELSCEVVGSRPPPLITWWLGGVRMVSTRELSSGANSTTSFLTFIPSMEDNEKRISCKGTHSFISDCEVEDGWKLLVYHLPWLTVSYDPIIDENDIREGNDVHFICELKSNPWVITVGWQHNGEPIYNDPAGGILISNQTLTLKNVERSRSGNYTCYGNNLEGRGESNILELDVKYAPVCRRNQSKIYRVAINSLIDIPCEMDANPPKIEFTWKFRYSDGHTVKLPDHFVLANGSSSIAHYTPTSEDDFPVLICSGRNTIGNVEEPCTFYLSPANSPEPPNCKVTKQTESSLHVECIDELNRGIRGKFIMEVYDAQTGKLVRNVTSAEPTFSVRGLESGIGFDVDLYVTNKEGKSLVTRLPTFTLTSKQVSEESALLSIYTLLFILAGVVGALIILAIMIVVVIRCRGVADSSDDNECNGLEDSSGRYMPMGNDKFNRKTGSNTSYDSFDTDAPDMIT